MRAQSSKSYSLMIAAALFLHGAPSFARLEMRPTPEQARDDVALLLKRIHVAQYAKHAETGKFSSDLGALKVSVPSFLGELGKLRILLDKESKGAKGYLAEFVLKSTDKAGGSYKIDHTGKLRGMPQYATARELVADILRNIKAIYMAQNTYKDETGSYSADLAKIGYQVPLYLRPYAHLEFAIVPKSGGKKFKATFKGHIYPIQGREFSIDEAGKVSGSN